VIGNCFAQWIRIDMVYDLRPADLHYYYYHYYCLCIRLYS